MKISIFEKLCEPIFSQNDQRLLFWPKFAQKWVLVSEFQKSKSGFVIIQDTKFSVKIDNFEFFGLNLGKLANYARCIGVAESWIEAKMSWVEMDGAGWRLEWARWRWRSWVELSGGRWSWVKVGARFSHTHISAWVFSCKFASYFQSTFS